MRFTKIFLGTLLLTATLGVHNALAQVNCAEVPDCAELGYSNDAKTCSGSWLYCPFNSAYKKCVPSGNSCEGFTKDDKTQWCNVIVPCSNDESLTLCASSFKCPVYTTANLEAGDCGTSKEGWTVISTNVTATNGASITCGKCKERTCAMHGYKTGRNKLSGEHFTCTSGNVFLGDTETTCYNCECNQGYVLVGNECKPAYRDCQEANLLTQPYSGLDCFVVPIWSPDDGKQTDCYECEGGSSGGSGNPLDDCIEKCKDDCYMRLDDCDGYLPCVENCRRTYG